MWAVFGWGKTTSVALKPSFLKMNRYFSIVIDYFCYERIYDIWKGIKIQFHLLHILSELNQKSNP